MDKLLVVDGNSILFRAYYATINSSYLTTKNGIPTNAVYTFIMMLNKAIEMIRPSCLLVAWDAGKPTFRHEKYPAYKGQRKPIDDEFKVQFPVVREYLDQAGIMRYEQEGFEADDIIGSIAKANPETKTTILSSDHDLLQLIDDTTSVLLVKKGMNDLELMDEKAMIDTYGITPLQIIDEKGLMGDASDNIPGVRGVGPKTAVKYLQQYGSVENLYEHIDEIKGKIKEKLIEGKESAFMSKELATIYTKMELPFTLTDCTYHQPDQDRLNQFFEKYEMRSLIKKSDSSKKIELIHIEHFEDVCHDDFIMTVCTQEAISEQRLLGFMIPDKNKIYYITADDALYDDSFKAYLKNDVHSTWDIKQTLHLLDNYGFDHPDFKDDHHLAAFLLNSQATDTDSLIKALEIELSESLHDLSKKTKNGAAYSPDRMEKVYSELTYQLKSKWNEMYDQLEKQNLMDLYQNIELPLTDILYRMEKEGISIDGQFLDEYGDMLEQRLNDLEKEVYTLAGHEFNLNSPKQMATVLYDELGLKTVGKKKSTAADVLEKLRHQHPVVDLILDYRKVAKVMSTYVEGLKKHIQPDQKIHTTFNQAMTQTGRLSSSDPNLQNITVRDELGKEIRKAFVAPDGYQLLSADYSQIELRMLAHMANEEHMIQAFNEGSDIHTKTATLIFGCDASEVDDHKRRVAKTVNFGIIYGQTEYGLSNQLGISRKESAAFMESYFENYPRIQAYMDELIAFCQKNGYVETLFHRRRYIPEINDKNFMIREFGKRAAMNAPIQGSAADLIKIAMIKTDAALKKTSLDAKMILQIHDELIFLVVDEDIDKLKTLLKDTMEHAIELSIPLKASINIGKTWYEAK